MRSFVLLLIITFLFSCRSETKKQEDEIYSRHLQRKVQLTILNTPLPDDASKWNLLLMNDGNEMEKLDLQKIIDSLYQLKKIGPLIVVGIHTGDRIKEYGVSAKPDYEGRGSKAEDYSEFVGNELIPFIKKNSGTNKFKTIAIAGVSLGGLSAMDVAWNNSNKIDKVGILSGAFWWRDKDITDSSYSDDKNRIMIAKIRASRKSPNQDYFFSYGLKEEESDRDKDGIIDVADDTKDLIENMMQYRKISKSSITVVENPKGRHDWPWWREVMPAFLEWAF
ncbi:MAG: alpha/beta hydrolase [Flavitalea sp.]